MASSAPYRRHTPQFKFWLCQESRSGELSRSQAHLKYNLSTALIQSWLVKYDRGEINGEEVEASTMAEYEVKIAALERKVGQLTMELDLLKNAPRLRLVSSS